MKTKRTKACVVEALFRTSFCTKTSTRFCTECGLALTLVTLVCEVISTDISSEHSLCTCTQVQRNVRKSVMYAFSHRGAHFCLREGWGKGGDLT